VFLFSRRYLLFFILLGGALVVGFFFLSRGRVQPIITDNPKQEKTSVAYLGVTYIPITTKVAAYYNLKADKGALVTAVAPGSPAERAGLKPNDIILALSGQNLDEENSLLHVLMQCCQEGKVDIKALRGERHFTLWASMGGYQ